MSVPIVTALEHLKQVITLAVGAGQFDVALASRFDAACQEVVEALDAHRAAGDEAVAKLQNDLELLQLENIGLKYLLAMVEKPQREPSVN